LQNGTTDFSLSMLGLHSFRFMSFVGPFFQELLQLLNSFPRVDLFGGEISQITQIYRKKAKVLAATFLFRENFCHRQP
jgi:hypothetical protein